MQPTPAAATSVPRKEGAASPARPVGPEMQPASPKEVAPAAANVGAASGATRMPQAVVKALLARGDALFAVGDVSGARLLYERAASGGSARAAATVGKTYDPAFLASIKARGMQPDPKAAAAWYRTAVVLGDTEALQLLRRLGAEPNQ
jgi:TPR repeat protein